MRVGLFTNNYLPFRGGVTTAVETLREGLDALGHRAWVFVPAPTYPGFALPLPLSPRLARTARQLQLEIFHAQHPFLLGPAARRLARAGGRPIVFTYHTRYEVYAPPWWWCRRGSTSIASVPGIVRRRDAGWAFPPPRRSASTSAASIARRAWSGSSRPSRRSPRPPRERACSWSGRGATRGPSSDGRRPAARTSASTSWAASRARSSRPTTRRPISSSSPRRRRRRVWSWPRRTPAGCPRWPCGPRESTR